MSIWSVYEQTWFINNERDSRRTFSKIVESAYNRCVTQFRMVFLPVFISAQPTVSYWVAIVSPGVRASSGCMFKLRADHRHRRLLAQVTPLQYTERCMRRMYSYSSLNLSRNVFENFTVDECLRLGLLVLSSTISEGLPTATIQHSFTGLWKEV